MSSLMEDMGNIEKTPRSAISRVPELAEEVRMYLALVLIGKLEWDISRFNSRRVKGHYGVSIGTRQLRNWINDIDSTASTLWRAYQGEDLESDEVQEWIDRANKEAADWES